MPVNRRYHAASGSNNQTNWVLRIEHYSVLAGDYAHALLGRDTLAAVAVKMNDRLYAGIGDVPFTTPI
jgi:hypothetical protein